MSNQTKVAKAESWELLEALELAMNDVECGMENLRGYADDDFEDWYDTLNDMLDWMNKRREELEIIETASYHEQMDELRKEYYRSVM